MINNAFILDFSILAEQNLSIEEFITIIHLKEGIVYNNSPRHLKSLEEKLRDVKSKYENDEEVKIIEAMINDVEGLLLASLALNTPVMKKLFSKILIGDLSKIDYSDEEYKTFAVNVLINFFLIMQPSKEK